jgi:hypothetical protein
MAGVGVTLHYTYEPYDIDGAATRALSLKQAFVTVISYWPHYGWDTSVGILWNRVTDDISVSKILQLMQSVKATESVTTRAAQRTKNSQSHCGANPCVILR